MIDLATHARTHPDTGLDRWHPASAFYDPGVFYRQSGNPQMMVHGPKGLPRPDGAGVWTEHEGSVPFFLEYDTDRERLDVLTTADLRTATGTSPAEPVWQLSGRSVGRYRLVELPYSDTNRDNEFPALARQPPD